MARNGIALAVLAVLAEPRTQHDGSYQGQHATNGMDDGRTGKVMKSDAKGAHHEARRIGVAEPARTPRPVTFDGIYQ